MTVTECSRLIFFSLTALQLFASLIPAGAASDRFTAIESIIL